MVVNTRLRPRPTLQPEYCKGCLRCVDACPKHCIAQSHELNPLTGLRPVELHLEDCNGCQLCIQACPEPYGLQPQPGPVVTDVPMGERTPRSGETPMGPSAVSLGPSPASAVAPGPASRGGGGPTAPAAALRGPSLPFPTAAHGDFELEDPEHLFGPRTPSLPEPRELPPAELPLPSTEPVLLKGTYAAALGALLAGCRHVFGYPITPSTEGAELMAKVLPHIGGSFVQAVSEVAAINMMYGCAGAGLPSMTFTSSPGFSLMLEGISYMVGAELPAVIVNVMRGGPGLGNIAPEQADLKLMARGLGHGNTHAIVLAPSTPQEMMDLTRLAFELAFAYRNPVIVAADGYLGQMAGVVRLPSTMTRPGLPAWAVWGDREHRNNLVCSIQLREDDLEAHNRHLNAKYATMVEREQRAESWQCDDAEVIVIACNTPARMAKGAVQDLRRAGVRAGLFRPITVWPFPMALLARYLNKGGVSLAVVEASPGQLEDELRLALSRSGVATPEILPIQRFGGVLPQRAEIVEALLGATRAREQEVEA